MKQRLENLEGKFAVILQHCNATVERLCTSYHEVNENTYERDIQNSLH